MKNVTIVTHPLVQHHLALLRDEQTAPWAFRKAMDELAALMAYEATRGLPVRSKKVKTPLGWASGLQLKNEVLIVPVLRAGLGMCGALLRLLPEARVGFIGLKREESTLQATTYHKSLPTDLGATEVVLLDPMLATGGSALAALDLLVARRARKIRLVGVVAAPEGIQAVQARHPAVEIFTAAVDRKLNEHGYIVPGLGDAGDRLFGV